MPSGSRRTVAATASFFIAGSVVAAASGTPLRASLVDGIPYVTLDQAAEFYGMRRVTQGDGMTLLRSSWSTLGFETDSRRFSLNGTRVWLHAPIRRTRGQAAIGGGDMERVLDPLLRSRARLRGYRCRVVLLDPGHGGGDTGAIGPGGRLEKEAVLDIARRVRHRLINRGYLVHMTRDSDRAVSLRDRALRAGAVEADLLVSIHLNAAASPEARGIETFVLTAQHQPSTHEARASRTAGDAHAGQAHEAASTVLGFELQHALRRHTGLSDRGLRRARFQVLRESPCPAALVECGFLTHPREAALLRTDAFRDRIADALAEGIGAYDRRMEQARDR